MEIPIDAGRCRLGFVLAFASLIEGRVLSTEAMDMMKLFKCGLGDNSTYLVYVRR